MSWITGGEKTAPIAGTVLVDTGPMPAGPYYLQMAVSATVALGVRLEIRNAANTQTVISQLFGVPASGTFEFKAGGEFVLPEDNARFRITTFNALSTGTAQASFIW